MRHPKHRYGSLLSNLGVIKIQSYDLFNCYHDNHCYQDNFEVQYRDRGFSTTLNDHTIKAYMFSSQQR